MREASYTFRREVNKLKTNLVLKYKRDFDVAQAACIGLRDMISRLRRTKKGLIFKADMKAYEHLKEELSFQKKELNRASNRYWKLRHMEKGIKLDDTAAKLFGLWASKNEYIKD